MLPNHKTKIVCTIGPACTSQTVMEQMLHAGMNIARLNFSHGDFDTHKKVIESLRMAAKNTGKRLAILADLPGPKMRIGEFESEPVQLQAGALFTLTTNRIKGTVDTVSMSFEPLPRVVKPGNTLFLNDGLIQLVVTEVNGTNVVCQVVVGGELRSRKGLNLPDINLGIGAFTKRDQECLAFAKQENIDAVSQSFVETAADIVAVRAAAAAMDYHPFVIAKMERSNALKHSAEILDRADGIMIARGDLGVETPVEKMAVVQKQLIRQANLAGKPVITATQMLESMTTSRRPTRAEATDVANAILDGTDCVMLSAESAMGQYPVEAVAMLSAIAEATEPHLDQHHLKNAIKKSFGNGLASLSDLVAFGVASTAERMPPAAVFVPTRTGATARNIARFRLPLWVIGISSHETTCQHLQFSSGIFPVYEKNMPEDWNHYLKTCSQQLKLTGKMALLTEGPSARHPDRNNRMEVIDLSIQ